MKLWVPRSCLEQFFEELKDLDIQIEKSEGGLILFEVL